jgi:GNAT superfamily N-acetyltransferase
MLIRALHPDDDLARVADFYRDAPDYWIMAEGRAPDLAKARAFFTDGPPGCDVARSHRLGLFLDGRLSGLAELSMGFPAPQDAYLGLMLLGPWAQNHGYGATFLADVVKRAQIAGAPNLYLAVLDANVAGARFWRRHGFEDTATRGSGAQGHSLTRMVRRL